MASEGLWHVCPAHVYEARVNANGPASGRRQLRELHQVRDLLADQRPGRLGPRRAAPLRLPGHSPVVDAAAGGRRGRPGWPCPPRPIASIGVARSPTGPPMPARTTASIATNWPHQLLDRLERKLERVRRRPWRGAAHASTGPAAGLPGDAGPLRPAAGGPRRGDAAAQADATGAAEAGACGSCVGAGRSWRRREQRRGRAGHCLGRRRRPADPRQHHLTRPAPPAERSASWRTPHARDRSAQTAEDDVDAVRPAERPTATPCSRRLPGATWNADAADRRAGRRAPRPDRRGAGGRRRRRSALAAA